MIEGNRGLAATRTTFVRSRALLRHRHGLASQLCRASLVVYDRWEREAVRYGKVVKDLRIKQR